MHQDNDTSRLPFLVVPVRPTAVYEKTPKSAFQTPIKSSTCHAGLAVVVLIGLTPIARSNAQLEHALAAAHLFPSAGANRW